MASSFDRLQHPLGNFVAGIGFIERNARIVATNLYAGAALHVHAHDIMQRYRLVDRTQLVEAVGSDGADLQSEIDLREGDRKSTRLNSSHLGISYAVFC